MSAARIPTNKNNQTSVTSSNLHVLREKITCVVCKKLYSKPKTLPCLHSFCYSCLASLQRSELSMKKLQCPKCQNIIVLEGKSLNSFPDAFSINRQISEYTFLQKVHGIVDTNCEKCTEKSVKATMFCDGCGKFVCDLCVTIHRNWSEFSSHKLLMISDLKECYHKYIPNDTPPLMCMQHEKDCSIFCETCHREICHECIIRSHRDHKYNLSEDSAMQHKLSTKEKLKMIDSVPFELESAIARLKKLSQDSVHEGSSIKAKIEKEFKEIELVVAKQKRSLIRDATMAIVGKVQLLDKQRLEQDLIKQKVVSCKDFVNCMIDNDHNSEFFVLKKQMCDRIAEVCKEFSTTELVPIEQPNIRFSFDDTIIKHLAATGSVNDGSFLHIGYSSQSMGAPSSSWISHFLVSEVITFYVALSSSFFKIRNNPADKISAEIRCVRDNSVCPTTVTININGFAKIQCTFAERGRYIFTINVGNQHVSGSPRTLFVLPHSSDQFHTPIRSITKLSNPKGIVINHKNQIIISQESLHNVTLYGKRCRKIVSFGSYGDGEAQFNHPSGLTIDKQDFIYVCDSKNNRVQKFDGDGNFVKEFSEVGDYGALNQPTGININEDDELFVVDRGNGHIVVLTTDLVYKRSFGSTGKGKGQFEDPWDIAFDSNRLAYITDIKMHTVHIFDPTGEYRGRIGIQGTQKSRLNRPSGIVIDQYGRIFVCEFGNHRVSIFHISSEFIDCFSTGLSMVNPHSITIDRDGFVYVSCADTVHIF